MRFIQSRLRRLEASARGAGQCPECRNTPQAMHAFYPEKGDEEPEVERCPKCGRPLGVLLRVLYDGGGGGT